MSYLPPVTYLPHDAPMLLLESVERVTDDTAVCRVAVNRQSVLAPFLNAEGDLPGWYALELMAQTVGVWSGWHRQQQGQDHIALGMVLGARELVCASGPCLAGAHAAASPEAALALGRALAQSLKTAPAEGAK